MGVLRGSPGFGPNKCPQQAATKAAAATGAGDGFGKSDPKGHGLQAVRSRPRPVRRSGRGVGLGREHLYRHGRRKGVGGKKPRHLFAVDRSPIERIFPQVLGRGDALRNYRLNGSFFVTCSIGPHRRRRDM